MEEVGGLTNNPSPSTCGLLARDTIRPATADTGVVTSTCGGIGMWARLPVASLAQVLTEIVCNALGGCSRHHVPDLVGHRRELSRRQRLGGVGFVIPELDPQWE